MKRYLVRAEAVNFGEIIFDTNDISTIRGGGLTALRLGGRLMEWARTIDDKAAKLVTSGASQAAASLYAISDAEALETGLQRAFREERSGTDSAPTDVLPLTIGAVELDGENVEEALKRAEARCRAKRFRQWTVEPLLFDQSARFPGKEDGTRPVASEDRLYRTTKARRKFGQENRQFFYNDILSEEFFSDEPKFENQNKTFPFRPDRFQSPVPANIGFVDSFEEMVRNPPKAFGESELPLSLRNSIAVFYADGNRFGAAVKKLGTQKFEDEIKPLRAELIKSLLEWLKNGLDSGEWERFGVKRDGKKHARFETLLWGGEEMLFVMPSWLAMEFVEKFFEWTKDWTVGDHALSHAVGVAIAHHKVPIRQLRTIASSAADIAKDFDIRPCNERTAKPLAAQQPLRACNSVTFEIFESLHPPDDNLKELREGLYGKDQDLPLKLAFAADAFREMRHKIRELRLGSRDCLPFPRSQLYRLCREIRKHDYSFAGVAASNLIGEKLDEFLSKAGEGRGWTRDDIRLPDNALPEHAKSHEASESYQFPSRGAGLDLALIVQFWDYACPFSDNTKDGDA